MRVCFLCTIFSRLLCGNFVWLCSSVKLTLLGCTNTILHIAYSSWTLPGKKPPSNKKNFTRHQWDTHGADAAVCTHRSVLFIHSTTKPSVFSLLCTDNSVCCQSCFDIYRTTSVISLIIYIKFQIHLHTFACTHTCLCPLQLVCSPL